MLALTPGLHLNVPMSEYVNDTLCDDPTISSSMANILIERSPLHARYAHPRFRKQEQDFSRVTNFGSAVAALVFGGAEIDLIDGHSYASKACKEARDAALAAGRLPLLTEEMTLAYAVSDVAKAAVVSLIGTDIVPEATIIFRQAGATCRSRPDALSSDHTVLLDLKVTGTNARDVNRQFFSQGYDMQAAFMERAADSIDPKNIGRREIFYLFVEVDPPHGYSFIQVSESTLQIARKKMNAAVNLWSHCLKENKWPSYQSSRQLTSRPSYEETAWLIREETDPMINVEFPQ